MKKATLIISLSLFATTSFAAPNVLEGDEAKAAYENRDKSTQTLVQRMKNFFLETDGEEVEVNKTEITVKAGTPLYIINDEKRYVHNIYDTNDKDWVIKKQKPKSVAAVTYDKKGVHKLRCAIHPKMRVTVNVE